MNPAQHVHPAKQGGDKEPEKDAARVQEARVRIPAHTDEQGRFVNGNLNPFPVPAKYRDGVDKETKLDITDPSTWQGKKNV